jgi:hypothetical protein
MLGGMADVTRLIEAAGDAAAQIYDLRSGKYQSTRKAA